MNRRNEMKYLLPALPVAGLFLYLAGSQAASQAALQAAEPLPPAVRATLDAVRADAIREHVRYLADDSLEGRDTASPGSELAATYLANQLKEMGVRPGGEGGSYFQTVPFTRSRVDSARTRAELAATVAGGDAVALEFGRDFTPLSAPGTDLRMDAPLVFAGYGIAAPEFKHDDYKSLDVKGKVVVTVAGEPFSNDPQVFAGDRDTRHADYRAKAALAREKGAAGIVVLLTGLRADRFPFTPLANNLRRPRVDLPSTSADFPLVVMRGTGVPALFQGAPQNWDEVQKQIPVGALPVFPLTRSLKVEVGVESTPAPGKNVLGLIEGSDPDLKKQVVVYSAHYDHIGKLEPGEGDRIRNGAWDNASGSAGVLETARAFSRLQNRPKRSVLFLWVTGEEIGLRGSQYYTRKPRFPIEQTAANINLDMTEIFGVPKNFNAQGVEESSLETVAEDVARDLGMKVGPDAVPELRTFTRSDQFSFAQVGVPCLFLKWGTEYEDLTPEEAKRRSKEKLDTIYHKVTDNFDPTWSWDGMRRHTQVAFLLGFKIASTPEMPQWKANSPFNKPRQTPKP